MDSLIIPIKQEYAEEILGGRKTVEFRRRFNPKYRKRAIVFYVTKPIRQVLFYGVVKRVFKGLVGDLWTCYRKEGGIKESVFDEYFQNCSIGYAIVLEQITKLNRPFKLEDLKNIGIKSLQSHRSITKEQFELITGIKKMDKNQYELISLIEKCNTFISDVPYNQLLDTSIKRGSLTKQEALSLLIGAEIDWDKSIKTDKETLIEFKRFNGRNYEEWILCVWYESDH